jgi:protease-4
VYKSGRFKDMLSMTREPSEITPEERAMIQHLVDQTFDRFKDIVVKGRRAANELNKDGRDKGQPLSKRWADFADGRVLSGKEAFDIGLVDELGYWETAIARTKKLARIQNANLIQYQQRFDISSLFRLLGKSDSARIKLDVGLDAPRLKAGQLYFLSPTMAH